MKKILYLVSTLEKTGPTNQLSYIIKYLDRKKYKPIVLTLSKERENSLKDYFIDVLKIQVESLNLSRIKGLLTAKKGLIRYVVENKIDLVHSQGLRADSLVGFLDIPTVSTLRMYPFYDYVMAYGQLQGVILAKVHLYYLKTVDRPIAVSKSVSELLLVKNKYKISFIRNGVDLEKFNGLEKRTLRKKLGFNKNINYFISVGDLSARKDPLTVIRAFNKADLSEAILIFLGDGDYYKRCINESRNSKNIFFMGNVDNVLEYLVASDFFVSASLSEGLPNSVIEAMTANLPCLLSNIQPHMEIVQMNEKSTLVFEVKNINMLKNYLKNIINEDYMVMSNASREIITTSLSADKMSKQYQEIYGELLC